MSPPLRASRSGHSSRKSVTARLPMAHTNWARLRAAPENEPLWYTDAALEVERVVALLVEDRVELARADPVGHEGAHHRAGARAHVEVEVVGAEARELVEGRERPDLVHPADDPAPGQHHGPPLGSPAPPEALEPAPQTAGRSHQRRSVAAQENPVPKATSMTRSPSLMRPSDSASWRQMATDAAAVFP